MGRERKVLYVDMDNVLVDFQSGIDRLPANLRGSQKDMDEVPGIFGLMEPKAHAIESYTWLAKRFDAYVLSTAPWKNPSAWSDKVEWVQKHLGDVAYKRLILTHHKNLNDGHFLVDDRLKNGADRFSGEHIHFGTDRFPDWPSVVEYLIERA